jgi:hypothetical protein
MSDPRLSGEAPDLFALNPATRLNRNDAAAALRRAGIPVAPSTLATMVCRGGGPKYKRFGRVPLYRAADLLAWLEEKLLPPVRSTSELDAARVARLRRTARKPPDDGEEARLPAA